MLSNQGQDKLKSINNNNSSNQNENEQKRHPANAVLNHSEIFAASISSSNAANSIRFLAQVRYLLYVCWCQSVVYAAITDISCLSIKCYVIFLTY
jgi:hypothetical protein